MTDHCETCRFWDRDHRDGQEAECKRRSPIPDPATDYVGRWPLVHKSQWCGEHKPILQALPIVPGSMYFSGPEQGVYYRDLTAEEVDHGIARVFPEDDHA
jgi:hypothetical protein